MEPMWLFEARIVTVDRVIVEAIDIPFDVTVEREATLLIVAVGFIAIIEVAVGIIGVVIAIIELRLASEVGVVATS
jgi:hypothetical protein